MIQTQLTTTQWLALPADVKAKLREVFSLKRSEGTNVVDGKVVSDGHTHPDLAVITPEAMETYLGLERLPDTTPDFYWLFDQVLDKVNLELHPETLERFDDTPAVPQVITPEAASIDNPSVQVILTGAPRIENNGDGTHTIFGAKLVPSPKERLGMPRVVAGADAKTKNKGGRPRGSKNRQK